MDNYLGTISIFSFGFVPSGWHACDGTLMQIKENQALFALIGPAFGGDGVTTFALPDLRGRVIAGSTFLNPTRTPTPQIPYSVGQAGGAETVTLTLAQLPMHTHGFGVNTAAATAPEPKDILASPEAGFDVYAPAPTDSSQLTPLINSSVSTAGETLAHENRQPYLTLNFCIAIEGIFPPRAD